MSMDYFGEKLKVLRKEKGWTQAQLASRLNLATATISSYEVGMKYPSVEVLIKLCETFDISSDYLLGLSENLTLQAGALTDEELKPFLQIISTIEKLKMKNNENEL